MSTILQPAAGKSKAKVPAPLKVINDAIIVQLEERDPAKQQTVITSRLVNIMTADLTKYQHKGQQAAKKGLHAPIHERYINVMIPPPEPQLFPPSKKTP
jgi:hypothetical protein